jgi:cytochrome c-type biogenesis protein CcmH
MTFWLIAALLTFLACAAMLWPFMRAGAAPDALSGYDIEVYRDQLAELDRDVARGVIAGPEAAEARAEIGRRLLKAASTVSGGTGGSRRAARLAASVAVLSVPLVAWGGYVVTGSPALPDQRLAERLNRNPAENTVEELIARAEQHLAANPADGRGWEVLAPIYMRTGRGPEAVAAWRNAIRLSGATAGREAGLGEALTSAAGGVVNAEAEAAFGRALALDPSEPRALFFTAMALAQEGRPAEAAAAWAAMAQRLPQDSPWQQVVARARASVDVPAAPAAGPSAEQVAAASDMPPEDRKVMIEGMVASLDARLRDNPGDVEGWQRLVRSYAVLGEAQAASDALSRGVAALGMGTVAAAQLLAFADGLGIKAGATR